MSGRGFIKETAPAKCELCGTVSELRPYGPRFENICFECAMTDKKTTDRRASQFLFGEDFDA